MKTHFTVTRKFGLFFAVAILALQAAPAAAADSGSGTYVTTPKGKKPFSVTFKDVYAFRGEDKYDKTKQFTVVILSDSMWDKQAMTAALQKERDWNALDKFLIPGMAFIRLKIPQDGKINGFYLRSMGPHLLDIPGGKITVKVNTAKRVEGSFSFTDPEGKIDIRFATDLADIGPGSPVKTPGE